MKCLSHCGLAYNYSAAPKSALPPCLCEQELFQLCSLALWVLTALVGLVCWFWCVCLFIFFVFCFFVWVVLLCWVFFLSAFSTCLKLISKQRNKNQAYFLPSLLVQLVCLPGWNTGDGIDFFEMYASLSLIGVLFLIFIWLMLHISFAHFFWQLDGIFLFLQHLIV